MALRLLLIDDDDVDRLAIRRALKQAGVVADIVEARTAADALAIAPGCGADVVLLDYQLPGSDGLSVLRALRAGDSMLPIIALTGFGDEQLAATMMKAGAADYLSKRSLSPDALERSIRHALAMRDAERERRLLLAREQQAREEAQAANQAKDQFLATLSHELRTPLNAILGWARLLGRDTLDSGSIRRAVVTIERNALLQVKLIEDLLDVSRIVSGKLTIERAPVDLIGVIAAAVESARLAADAQGVTLTLEQRATPIVMGDPARLQQVIANLLSNAIKFTPQGGAVTVAVAAAGGDAEVVVADSGEGIDPAFLPRMFQRFSQAETQTRRHGGLGLGLSIVRHLVELHGGRVRAHSDGLGTGTAVTIALPATEGAELALAPSLGGHLPSLRGLRVLVVDAHDDSREMVSTVLERCGASVRRCAAANDAIMETLLEVPDVVISDIAMPGGDGYTLMQQLRALRPQTFRAVAITPAATADDRTSALAAGFDAHLAKPIDPLILAQTLLRLTARQPPDVTEPA